MKRQKVTELYLEVARVVGETLQQAGLNPSTTIRLTTAITAAMCRNFAGGTVYFPLNVIEQRVRKAASIVAEFDGGNLRELALKHDLSENCVRNILRRSRHSGHDK